MGQRRSTDTPARLQRRRRRPQEEAPALRRQRAAGQPPGVSGPEHATGGVQRQDALREIQRHQGNRHAQELIAREAAPPPAAVWDSEHGSYRIFPDGQPLALDMVADPRQEWPLSRKLADRLRPVSDLLAGGASEVELKGGPAFKVALLIDLAWLIEQPAGRDLLAAALRSGRRLTLEYAPDGGEIRAASPADAELRPDGSLGPGSDVLLPYGPAPWSPSSGDAGWERRKPALGLARALVAALPLLGGSAPTTREREPVTADRQASGEDRLKRAIADENRLRAAFGMPLRPEE